MGVVGPDPSRTAPPSDDELRAVVELKRAAIAAAAVGPLADLARRRMRNAAIVAAIGTGETPRELAKQFGITARQITRMLATREKAPSDLGTVPLELIKDLLRSYRESIADFEAMAARYVDTHPTAALGAKRSALETRDKLAVLLQAIGKLPENLEVFRSQEDMRRTGLEMIGAIELAKAGELSLDELQRRFEQVVDPSAPPAYDAEFDDAPAELERGEGEAA